MRGELHKGHALTGMETPKAHCRLGRKGRGDQAGSVPVPQPLGSGSLLSLPLESEECFLNLSPWLILTQLCVRPADLRRQLLELGPAKFPSRTQKQVELVRLDEIRGNPAFSGSFGASKLVEGDRDRRQAKTVLEQQSENVADA